MTGGSHHEGSEEDADEASPSIGPLAATDASEMALADLLSAGEQPTDAQRCEIPLSEVPPASPHPPTPSQWQDAWLRHRRLEILIAADLRRSDSSIVGRVRTLIERAEPVHERQMALQVRQRLSRRRPVLRRLAWAMLLMLIVGLAWAIPYGNAPIAYTADGIALRPGAVIDPGNEVRFRDGSTLTAGQGAEVTLVAGQRILFSHAKQVRLIRGSLTVNAVPQPEGQPLTISTPQGIATLLDAACVIGSDPLGTRVAVERGQVNVGTPSHVAAALVAQAQQVGAVNDHATRELAANIVLHVDATGHPALSAGQLDRAPDGTPALRGQLYHQPTNSVGLYLASYGVDGSRAASPADETNRSPALFRWASSLHFRIRGYSLAARVGYLWCGSNGQGWVRQIALPGGWFAIDCDASGFVDDLQRQPASPLPGQLITELSIALSPVDEMRFTTFDVVDQP